MKTLAEIRAQRPSVTDADIAAERDALIAEIALHALREHRGVSQERVAEALHVSRPRVSTIERAGEDLRISTIARYVRALGGRLEVRAVFDDEDVPLQVLRDTVNA
jgi:transcriptional regulator with XRE-family HTH domain